MVVLIWYYKGKFHPLVTSFQMLEYEYYVQFKMNQSSKKCRNKFQAIYNFGKQRDWAVSLNREVQDVDTR